MFSRLFYFAAELAQVSVLLLLLLLADAGAIIALYDTADAAPRLLIALGAMLWLGHLITGGVAILLGLFVCGRWALRRWRRTRHA